MRKVVQWLTLFFCNANLSGFLSGRIYRGWAKTICVPGLNCYSCPGAVASCPLGALQAVLGAAEYRFSFYVTGLLLGFGALFGRFVCGFLCPFGLLQELLRKIPFYRVKKLWRGFLYLKYVLLAALVVGVPLLARNYADLGDPAFCKYVCPAGTLTAGLPLLASNPSLRGAAGGLFALKLVIAAAVVVGCMAVCRFFCKVLCPLGAFYGLFNKVALYRIRLEEKNCTHCGACSKVCKMAIYPSLEPNSPECVRCGDCVRACRFAALEVGFCCSRTAKENVSA